jgi:hypothetical protein
VTIGSFNIWNKTSKNLSFFPRRKEDLGRRYRQVVRYLHQEAAIFLFLGYRKGGPEMTERKLTLEDLADQVDCLAKNVTRILQLLAKTNANTNRI